MSNSNVCGAVVRTQRREKLHYNTASGTGKPMAE